MLTAPRKSEAEFGKARLLSDWELGEVHAGRSTSRNTSLDEGRARFTLVIGLHRRGTFDIWRVLLPLILLVVASSSRRPSSSRSPASSREERMRREPSR